MNYENLRKLSDKVKERHPESIIALDWMKGRASLEAWVGKDLYVFQSYPFLRKFTITKGMNKVFGDPPDYELWDREVAEDKFLSIIGEK